MLVTSRIFFIYPFATFNMVILVAVVSGRFLGGWLSDVLGRSWTLLLLFGLQAVAWTGLWQAVHLLSYRSFWASFVSAGV